MHIFWSFITTEIEDSCTVDVRISDNVLEEDAWGYDRLTIKNGSVIEQRTLKQGVYTIPKMIGLSTNKLAEWSKYDSTGNHPEIYHELKIN